MTWEISYVEAAGQTLYGRLQKFTYGSGATAPSYGDVWDDTNDQWDVLSNIQLGADLIALTETSGRNGQGLYRGATNTDLGTYTGYVDQYVWDGVDNLSASRHYVVNGQLRTGDGNLTITDVPFNLRWHAVPDAATAGNRIYLSADDSVTLSMDFSPVLAEDDSILRLLAVDDQSVNALVPTNLACYSNRRRANCDVTGLTSGLTYQLRFKVDTAYGLTKTMDGVLEVL